MSNWKYEERAVAKKFNTKRKLLTGTDEKSDIDDPLFAVDCKLRKHWQIKKWYNELASYARKHNKIPILTVREPTSKQRLAVLDMDHLVSILKGKGLIQNDRID